MCLLFTKSIYSYIHLYLDYALRINIHIVQVNFYCKKSSLDKTNGLQDNTTPISSGMGCGKKGNLMFEVINKVGCTDEGRLKFVRWHHIDNNNAYAEMGVNQYVQQDFRVGTCKNYV